MEKTGERRRRRRRRMVAKLTSTHVVAFGARLSPLSRYSSPLAAPVLSSATSMPHGVLRQADVVIPGSCTGMMLFPRTNRGMWPSGAGRVSFWLGLVLVLVVWLYQSYQTVRPSPAPGKL